MAQSRRATSKRRRSTSASRSATSRGRGSKSAYSAKQKRKATHIEEGYEKRGVGRKEAEKRAWATVNKQDKGAKGRRSSKSRSRSAASRKRTTTASRSRTRSRRAA